MANILATNDNDTYMLDGFDARSSDPAVDLGGNGDNDDKQKSAGPFDAEAEEKDEAEIEGLEEGVPESIPDYASKALGVLYAELVALLPTSSPRIRRGVRMAHDFLKLSSKSKSFRRHAIAINFRCLRFFRRIAIQESKSGVSTAPGTTANHFLSFVLAKMSELHPILEHCVNMSTVKRTANRGRMHVRLQEFVQRLHTMMRDVQRDLSLHHFSLPRQPGPPPQALLMRSMSTCLKWVVDAISDDIHRRAGESRVALERITDLMTIMPFLRDIDADALPDGVDQATASDASTSTDGAVRGLNAQGEFDRVVKSDTDLEQLEFRSKMQAEHWAQQACDQLLALAELFSFRTTTQLSTALHGLHHMLIAACKICDYTGAEHVAEIIVAVLHERLLSQPSDLIRFRLANALAALTFILSKANRYEDAVRTIKEATLVLLPLFQADPDRYQTTMGLIRLEYGRLYLELWHRAPSALSDSLMRQARRMFTIATDLLRGALVADPSGWRSQLFLGRAFYYRSEAFRYNIGDEDGWADNDPDISAWKGIKWIRSAAQINPRLLELEVAFLVSETVSNLEDSVQEVALYKEIIDIYERWATVWSLELTPRLAEVHSSLGMVFLRDHKHTDAELAFTTAIELRTGKGGGTRSGIFRLRAHSNIGLERYRAALRDAELGANKEGDWQRAELLCIGGLCKWMMRTGQEAEALRDLLEGVRLYQTLGFSTRVDPDGCIAPDYFLALAWLGGVQSVTGSLTSAKKNGKLAVDLIRAAIKDNADWSKVDLARVLVFSAAILFKGGHTDRAKAHIEECVNLIKELPSIDSSTKRTAWLLKGHIHELEGAFPEAEEARTEATMLKCLGFFHQLAI
ncbi:hypothetical protein CF319_g1497 [Tilletia indica]|nr:hypothetical protein CF319_g1497 [Tilletia indica]